jgi:hypothetical protein
MTLATALERDYFMTGSSVITGSSVGRSYVCFSAQEAMDFGLVDGILERRLTLDSKE